MMATLRRPVRKAKTRKSNGVSLIAAASPVATPRGSQRRSPTARGSRSPTTSAISRVFTWP